MAAQERGVYQPQEDLAAYEDYPEEEGRSRLPLMIVIALVVVAAFGGVVWLAYNQGVAHGRAGAPPIVAAPAGPARTPPDETQTAAGGPTTPYTGLKVYGEPVPPDEEAASSALVTPASPDATTAEQTASAEPGDTSTRLAPDASTSAPPGIVHNPAPAAPDIVVSHPEPVPAPAVTVATLPPRRPPTPPASAPATQPPASVTELATSPPTPAAPPVEVASLPAAQSGGAATAGKAVLQIGSFPSEALANAAWRNFQRGHGGAVSGLSSSVIAVQIPSKGTWYRLRIGPFADRAAAGTKCAQLKAQGATCLVATP